jgi:AcrR family transcriptional regulator
MTSDYGGGGDPARSMALLWRTRERPSRKGKPDLSVDRIVQAAIEVADAEGLAALSMRRIAERLGVGTMSLYTHVPGKAELFDVMVDTVVGEKARPEDVPGGVRARLEQIAREHWRLIRRHPWLLRVKSWSRPVLGPNVTAQYDYDLRAVEGVGLTDLEMDGVITLIAGYVEGVGQAHVDMTQATEQTGMTDEQWWDRQAPFLEKVFDPLRFPTAARVGAAAGAEYNAASDPERAFEFGLARVLDGIEALVRERAQQQTEAGG